MYFPSYTRSIPVLREPTEWIIDQHRSATDKAIHCTHLIVVWDTPLTNKMVVSKKVKPTRLIDRGLVFHFLFGQYQRLL